jgi:4-amino-4-deoxy-L-arabinose transferase-like glycosyltransferase
MSRKEKIILAILLIVGLLLRIYKLEERLSFDWDQENFAWEAKKMIVDHKLTLIGAPTSVGGIHLGPFYTYLSNIFYFLFRMDPKGAGILSIIFGLFTILGFYLVGKNLFNQKVAFLSSFFYTFSLSFITWDLVAWNPAPFYLFVLLVIFFLHHSLREERYLIFLFLLLGLGFHLHFASLIFYPLTLLILVFFRLKPSKKTILLSLLTFFLSLSPLIVFDIRHDFHNAKSLFNFLFSQTNQFTLGGIKFFSIGKMIYNEVFSFLVYFWPGNLKKIFLPLFWFLLSFLWIFRKKERRILAIFYLTIFLTFIFYSFYPGHVTEYYLMTLVPILVLLVSFIFSFLPNFFLIFLLFLLLVFNLNFWWKYDKPLSLADKKAAVSFIINDSGNKPFRISLTCAPGYDTGYRYLLWFYKANLSDNPEDKIYTIVAPAGYHGIKSMKEFHGIGVLWEEGKK